MEKNNYDPGLDDELEPEDSIMDDEDDLDETLIAFFEGKIVLSSDCYMNVAEVKQQISFALGFCKVRCLTDKTHNCFYFRGDCIYREDEIYDLLYDIALFTIEGAITFYSEGKAWRYIYAPDNYCWIDQDGTIIFDDDGEHIGPEDDYDEEPEVYYGDPDELDILQEMGVVSRNCILAIDAESRRR